MSYELGETGESRHPGIVTSSRALSLEQPRPREGCRVGIRAFGVCPSPHTSWDSEENPALPALNPPLSRPVLGLGPEASHCAALLSLACAPAPVTLVSDPALSHGHTLSPLTPGGADLSLSRPCWPDPEHEHCLGLPWRGYFTCICFLTFKPAGQGASLSPLYTVRPYL